MSSPEAGKVPPAFDFLDISDYARPAARWLVAVLLNTPVTPIQLTLAFTAAGLVAGALFALDRWLWLAALLLLVKSWLDGADGSLARARRRPSRVGRFLDSVCDFVVNVTVLSGIAAGAMRRGAPESILFLALAALLSAVLQVSLYNRYYVLYRAQSGGDQTSRVAEAAAEGYAYDNEVWLRWLYAAYRLIYGWQDALVGAIDELVAGRGARLESRFMTAASLLGLGTQLMVMAICAILGQPAWSLWVFLVAFNSYALLLIALRRGLSARLGV